MKVSYDLHFQPPANHGRWPEGSHCEPLTVRLGWLDEILYNVNICHDIVLKENKDLEKTEANQYLNGMGISMMPLKRLFPQQSA